MLGLVFKTSVRHFVSQVGSTPTGFRQSRMLPILLSLALSVANAQAPKQRSFAIEYTATLPRLAPAAEAKVWIPIPVSGSHQSIAGLRIQSPNPYTLHTAANGDRILHTTAASGAVIKVSYQVTRREHIQPLAKSSSNTSDSPNCCLGPDRLVPIDGQIKQWAEEVVRQAKAKTDLEKARAIYNHVVATVKYDKTGKGWGRGDIYYACDARRGNCTDFHAIFIGYSRAVGIPARFAIGVPLPSQRGEGEIAGYHCWAEFYAQGIGWVPIDASEAAKEPRRREYFFGAHDENRVELSRGRDVILSPRQQAEPLNFFVYPYGEADGKVVAGIQTKVTFRDLFSAVTNQPARHHVVRLRPGQDLLAELTAYATKHSLKAAAVISAVGSLKQASLRYANKPEYSKLDGPFEVVSFSGTLDAASNHLHLSIADGNGVTRGGHAGAGNIVFTTMELVLLELPALQFRREFEPLNGYDELTISADH